VVTSVTVEPVSGLLVTAVDSADDVRAVASERAVCVNTIDRRQRLIDGDASERGPRVAMIHARRRQCRAPSE
jgi:hypothetical protein